MKERPIIFSGAMVRAILDGRKTQTRRIVAEQRGWDPQKLDLRVVAEHPDIAHTQAFFGEGWGAPCPYGKRGDRLWVREAWGRDKGAGGDGRLYYFADGEWRSSLYHATRPDLLAKMELEAVLQVPASTALPAKRSPIFMPRWASRLTLEVVSVRVERLNDISEADARAEGVETIKRTLRGPCQGDVSVLSARDAFRDLWDSINGARAAWASNPWVWVVEFKRVP